MSTQLPSPPQDRAATINDNPTTTPNPKPLATAASEETKTATLPSTNTTNISTTTNIPLPSTNKNIKISLLPDPTPAHAPALRAWTSLFGTRATTRPHPDEPTFKTTYSHPKGRLLAASTPENPVAGLVAWRKYDGRFRHIPELQFLDGSGGDAAARHDDDAGSDGGIDGGVVEVVRLFVTPELRHRGIATALVRALVALAREDGVGYMYLHTHPFLPGAERLWEKEGWGVLVRERGGPWFTIHMGRGV